MRADEDAHLTPLYKDISAGPDEVCSIETRLELSGDKLPLSGQLMSVLHGADGVILHTHTHTL